MNLSKLGPKQPAEITLDAVADKTYHGHLRQIVPAADRQKGTVRVKVAFDDADERILPDLSSRVSFTAAPTQGKSARARVLIPKAALATRDGKPGVFRIVDGRAKFQPVETGGDVQGQVEVTSGTGTTGYVVVAHAKTGRNFTITKNGSGISRTCAPSGGGCNGTTW